MTRKERDAILWEFGCLFSEIHHKLYYGKWMSEEIVGAFATALPGIVWYHYDRKKNVFTKLVWNNETIKVDHLSVLNYQLRSEWRKSEGH